VTDCQSRLPLRHPTRELSQRSTACHKSLRAQQLCFMKPIPFASVYMVVYVPRYGKCFRHPTRQRRGGRCTSSNLPPNLFDTWELVRFGFLVQSKARFLGCGTRRGTFLLPLRGRTQRRTKRDTASEAQRRQRETPKTPRDMARPLVVPREAQAVHRRRSALGFEH
jgi:hypothetical protein